MLSSVHLVLAAAFELLEVWRAMSLADQLQWIGAVLGLAGAYVLAGNNGISRWGWFGFLGANLFIGSFAYLIEANGLLLQQIGFTLTSLKGIWKADFPFLERLKSRSLRVQP